MNIVGRDATYQRPSLPEGQADWQYEVRPRDWKPPLHCGYKIGQTIAATTYADICVDGDWYNIQAAAKTYGTVNVTINQGGVGAKVYGPVQEPAYVEVFFNNIKWKIKLNAQVTVPSIIATILRESGYVR